MYMAYMEERLQYYADMLKGLGYYMARSTGDPESQTRYMISSSDWRRSVIFTSTASSCFRIDFLVVGPDDSRHMSEEDFVQHLEELKKCPVD